MIEQETLQKRMNTIRTLGGVRRKIFMLGIPVGFILLAVSVCMFLFSSETLGASRLLIATLVVFVIIDIAYWVLGSVIDAKKENFMRENVRLNA